MISAETTSWIRKTGADSTGELVCGNLSCEFAIEYDAATIATKQREILIRRFGIQVPGKSLGPSKTGLLWL